MPIFISILLKLLYAYFIVIDPIVTVVSSPVGTPVSGLMDTYEYTILSGVDLICMVGAPPDPDVNVTFSWNTTECYSHTEYNGDTPRCFPRNSTSQMVTGTDLTAEDAGTITCTVAIFGEYYTSEQFTLHISGELRYYVY